MASGGLPPWTPSGLFGLSHGVGAQNAEALTDGELVLGWDLAPAAAVVSGHVGRGVQAPVRHALAQDLGGTGGRHDPAQFELGYALPRGPQDRPAFARMAANDSARASALTLSQRLRASSENHGGP